MSLQLFLQLGTGGRTERADSPHPSVRAEGKRLGRIIESTYSSCLLTEMRLPWQPGHGKPHGEGMLTKLFLATRVWKGDVVGQCALPWDKPLRP